MTFDGVFPHSRGLKIWLHMEIGYNKMNDEMKWRNFEMDKLTKYNIFELEDICWFFIWNISRHKET